MNEVYQQLFSLVIFVLTGIAIGVLFDFFRILRKTFKTADWITCIQDILFWILAGLIILFSIFKFNNGEIRIYIFIGILFGLLIYMLTISKFIIKYTVFVIQFLKKIISYPINIFIKIIINPFKNLFRKIFIKCKNMIKNNKKLVKNQ